MALRNRIRKLEQEAQAFSDHVVLSDGTVVNLAPGARFDAVCALLSEERHRLLDLLPHLAPAEEQFDPSICDVATLLWRISAGKEEDAS